MKNKKITILALTIFVYANMVEKTDAAWSQEEYDELRATEVILYQAGALPATYGRDSYGFSRIGVREIDDERNKLENGGPLSLQRSQAYADSSYQAAVAEWIPKCLQTASQIRKTERAHFAAKRDRDNIKARASKDASDPSEILKQAMRDAEIQAAHARSMPAPIIPAPVTVARTEQEEYQIALKVLEKSKELQDYAALLAQSRKP